MKFIFLLIIIFVTNNIFSADLEYKGHKINEVYNRKTCKEEPVKQEFFDWCYGEDNTIAEQPVKVKYFFINKKLGMIFLDFKKEDGVWPAIKALTAKYGAPGGTLERLTWIRSDGNILIDTRDRALTIDSQEFENKSNSNQHKSKIDDKAKKIEDRMNKDL